MGNRARSPPRIGALGGGGGGGGGTHAEHCAATRLEKRRRAAVVGQGGFLDYAEEGGHGGELEVGGGAREQLHDGRPHAPHVRRRARRRGCRSASSRAGEGTGRRSWRIPGWQ